MIEKLSKAIVEQWVKYKIIEPENKASYHFGVQLLISTIINFLLAILISIFLVAPTYWVAFLLGFIPLRLSAGGYHARTHSLCIICFCTAFGILGVLSKLIFASIYMFFTASLSFLIIWRMSPVSAPNKVLTEKQRDRNRAISITLAVFNWILMFIMLRCFTISRNIIFYLGGEQLATISVFLQVVFDKLTKVN